MNVVVSILIGNTFVATGIALLACAALWRKKSALAHALWLVVLAKIVMVPFWHVPVNSSISSQSIYLGSVLSGALMLSWIAGSVCIALVAVIRIVRFRKLLRHAQPASESVCDQVGEIAWRIGVRVPQVRVMPGAMPMLFGFSRSATLILPQSLVDHLNESQRDTIIAHELAHLRRGDPWVRLLEMFVTIVLWWHPLVWIARRGVRVAEEQCCDAWVVATLPDSRKTYAGALVDTMALFSRIAPLTAPVASGLGQIRDLRARLAMIMSHNPSKSLSRVGMIVVATLMLALPMTPVAAPSNATPVRSNHAVG